MIENAAFARGGEWVIDQGGTGSISIIVGYSRTPVEFRCRQGSAVCHGVFVCASVGIQANLAFQWNLDIEEVIGTGSVIRDVYRASELSHYTYSSLLLGAGPFSTSGNNIAIGPGIGLNIAKQWCNLKNFWCE